MNTFRTRHTQNRPCIECFNREAKKQRLKERRVAIIKWLVRTTFHAIYPVALVFLVTEGVIGF